jgi:hypothetical protein
MISRIEKAIQEFKRLRRLGVRKDKALAETAITKGVLVSELEIALIEQELKDRQLLSECKS